MLVSIFNGNCIFTTLSRPVLRGIFFFPFLTWQWSQWLVVQFIFIVLMYSFTHHGYWMLSKCQRNENANNILVLILKQFWPRGPLERVSETPGVHAPHIEKHCNIPLGDVKRKRRDFLLWAKVWKQNIYGSKQHICWTFRKTTFLKGR